MTAEELRAQAEIRRRYQVPAQVPDYNAAANAPAPAIGDEIRVWPGAGDPCCDGGPVNATVTAVHNSHVVDARYRWTDGQGRSLNADAAQLRRGGTNDKPIGARGTWDLPATPEEIAAAAAEEEARSAQPILDAPEVADAPVDLAPVPEVAELSAPAPTEAPEVNTTSTEEEV